MESLRVFHNFKLDDLNDDWIRSIWDAEFTMYDRPPDEYAEFLESDDARLLLHESCRVLKAWITTNERKQGGSETEFSWQALMILNINIRGLLATLGYIIKSGQCAETDEASRQACLEATSLYFMLLAVPGSNAFGIYHPNLYQKAIETLKLSEHLFPTDTKNNREIDAANCSTDDEFSESCVLSRSEKLKLAQGLNRIIPDLITMLKSFRFKEHAESLDITIRILLNIIRLMMYVKFQDDYKIATLSQTAFAALRELCNNSHGTVDWTIMLIVQCTMSDLVHNTNAQPKSITIVHEAVIYFLKSLLKIHEQETTQGILILIHQLMVKCPDRLEGRQRQAAILIKLLNICNEAVFAIVLQDLILFSYNCKISYRLFAQEIVGKLLTESSLSNEDLKEDTKAKLRKVLLAIVSSRCMDRSSWVRGKAMATLAAFSDCSNEADKGILRNIFTVSASDKRFPGLNELKNAMQADADFLPGSNTLITMLLERVNDERALVRRSALKILRNLSIMFPSLVSKTTHVMSDCCRDLTLTVRQFAVHVFSELLEQFPHDSSLLNEWIQAVVPQIYDIEAKVQEKVLECLQSLLIGRITSASSYVPDAANSLPWRILNKLSRMRMRKHLSKACSLWVKNGVISNSLISKVQSHIGTDNTVGAWILLAAMAENMKIPNINKHITDYKEVIRKNDFHASLVLHVLRHTWSVLDRDALEDLHQHLYECIRRFEINFNLISVCLDILSGVLRHLHGDKNGRLIKSSMTELMRLSEAEIRDLLEDEDCTQDASKTTRAIFTLGHASLLCTSTISSSTLRMLGRLLLQWDSLPEAVREMRDLQAAAVVVLCQEALRDLEIAREVTPILGSLMRRETSPDSPAKIAVKVNAAKALADICVRFTALVEPYLSDMCISMKDSNPAVREAIVVIFIQLLLEDFIKLKGPFFFHILTMLSDANSMIRELTVFLVEERLLAKNKTLISQQFLESIFHYNNYQSQNTFCGQRMHNRERKLLTLPGPANQAKRNVIYEFMLEHLDAAARFQLLVKLTKYILREICIGDSIDVTTEEGAHILRDAMFIIGNSRLQLSSFSERHKDDTMELDEATPPSGMQNNNTANAVVTALKKYNLDHLLPTLIMLKKKLAALKSPLEDDVDSQLFKTYSECDKDHLLNLLNEYPELEKEMECYQRRLKDKNISENDDDIVLSPVGNQDSLLHLCKRKTPQVLLHRLSSSMISHYKNNGSVSSDKPVDSSESITALYDTSPSEHLEKILQTPPPEPNFCTSTPISTRVLNSNDAPARGVRMKRPSSERGVSPPDISHKISQSSVSRC